MAKQARGFNEVRRYVAGIDIAGHADHCVCGPRKEDGTHDIEHFGTRKEKDRADAKAKADLARICGGFDMA